MDRVEIEKQIADLKALAEHTRNASDKCSYLDQVKVLEKQLSEEDVKKEVILQNDTPVRADHSNESSRRIISRGDVVEPGNTFIAKI